MKPWLRYLMIGGVALSLRAVAEESPVEEDVALRRHTEQIVRQLQDEGYAVAALGSSPTAEAIQRALDPLCFGNLEVSAEGSLRFLPAASPPPLLEQGWRAMLLKIINPARRSGTLRVQSANAGDIPNVPREEGARRWLGLEVHTGIPFSPNLNGSGVEYRLLRLWAREAGPHTAEFSFNFAPIDGAASQRWDFDRDAEGWTARRDVALDAHEGALRLTRQGERPRLDAPLSLPPGEKRLRFHARNAGPPHWRVSWRTAEPPADDRPRSRDVTVFQDLGQGADFSLSFETTSALTGLSLHPDTGTGTASLDWIEVIALAPPAAESLTTDVALPVEPSRKLTFSVQDEHGQPCTAAFTIRDHHGRLYPLPSKRLAPDFFFQSQIYRADGESIRLPAGRYHIDCARGPESVPERKEFTMEPGQDHVLEYRVQRWIDPSVTGWWSGDHHIHAAGCAHYSNPTEGVFPQDMQRHIMGEDLKIGCNLTWGPCFDFQKQFFTGRIDEVSRYPYLLRYDIEVSGFGSHQSGHLCLLRLQEQIVPGGDSKAHWPTLGLNTLIWAKRQGAITGPAHSGSGLGGNTGRVEGPEGPDGLPSYIIPDYDGIGANEYVVQIAHDVPGPDGQPVRAVDFISTMDTDRKQELNMWYHGLNCGFRVRASGETDFPCITGERVGGGRVYVKVDGRLDFDRWCDGLRDGRSYVSDGKAHLMDFQAEGVKMGEADSELRLERPGPITLTVRAASRTGDRAEEKLEVIVNGYPVAATSLPNDGVTRDVSLPVTIERSSWVALRYFPSAHTNPIFVLVDGKPIRASRRSAEWLRRGVDQCWKVKEPTYAEAEKAQARTAYDHARKVYDALIAESDVP